MNKKKKRSHRQEAHYLHISIPYDKDDKYGLISFDNGWMTELECEEDFVPPMLMAKYTLTSKEILEEILY